MERYTSSIVGEEDWRKYSVFNIYVFEASKYKI